MSNSTLNLMNTRKFFRFRACTEMRFSVIPLVYFSLWMQACVFHYPFRQSPLFVRRAVTSISLLFCHELVLVKHATPQLGIQQFVSPFQINKSRILPSTANSTLAVVPRLQNMPICRSHTLSGHSTSCTPLQTPSSVTSPLLSWRTDVKALNVRHLGRVHRDASDNPDIGAVRIAAHRSASQTDVIITLGCSARIEMIARRDIASPPDAEMTVAFASNGRPSCLQPPGCHQVVTNFLELRMRTSISFGRH
ncbi:uncharacterized protein EKO05_0010093 [Ascochyta rabiei]|uniref:uncharacterized protein n=1 Tax=Didymella rabiei TaxID=5454 RepID=UPI00220A9B79|nr:uncharacterized protein EKO05_0010093 [Ascochyta rabiei]UPX19842.1 hypothetical protein EKO05_0010093 [Ascochyta rabiei]